MTTKASPQPSQDDTPKPKAKRKAVLVSALNHGGKIHKPGADVPADLTDTQIERLTRLGVIGT